LWWRGCPSTAKARAELVAAMERAGLDPAAIDEIEVPDDGTAGALGFVGSPTVRVDGHDVQPPGEDEPVGLSCRVYRLRDGRVSPTPDPRDLDEALRCAA
jgi:hypothetical protein